MTFDAMMWHFAANRVTIKHVYYVLNVQEIMVVIQTAGTYRGRWLTNVSMGMVVMEGEIRGLSCL